jgi:N-acetylmuramic acid 6-phosphate etherase
MYNTESLNPQFADIDSWPTQSAVETMLDQQIAALSAIKNQTAMIANAAEMAAQRLGSNGRLVYVGAGTSGRVAVQDGVELGPTFGWPESRLCYIMAGGIDALVKSAEGTEDDAGEAAHQVALNKIGPQDVMIGVAASGNTPFTVSAVTSARAAGAMTIAIANNPDTKLLQAAEFSICAETGSEVVAGSTRMKAGTAQKAILNMLSTAIMLRLGRVYRGLMVDMIISNDKLLNRAHGIIKMISGCTDEGAINALDAADRNIKKAVLIAMGASPGEADDLIIANGGILRQALKDIQT